MQDSDCERYNVANPLRFASPNPCTATDLTWERELCERAEDERTCTNERGCDAFKASLKLSDLPRSLQYATFSGQHYAGVTGDLTDLAGMENLATLALPASTEITGDLATLATLAAATPASLTNLVHLDLGATTHVHGDITNLPAGMRYVNLGSAQGLQGDVANLKTGLEYANFRAARWIVGTIQDAGRAGAAGAACTLRELNLHNSVGGAGMLTGFLANNNPGGGGAVVNGILTRCPDLNWLDVGRAFGTVAASVQAGSTWNAATATACIHTGRRTASRACRNGQPLSL